MLTVLWEHSEQIRTSTTEGRVVAKRLVKDAFGTTMPSLNAFAKAARLRNVDTSSGEKGYMLEDLAQAVGGGSYLAELDGRTVRFSEPEANQGNFAVAVRENSGLTEDFLVRSIDFAMANGLPGSFEKLVTILASKPPGVRDG